MATILLSCSPRAGGNSDLLTEWTKARFCGAETIRVRDLSFRACEGCGACETRGSCRFCDDADAALRRIRGAERTIVVAPCYFCGFDGRTKAFLDRAQAWWGIPRGERRPLYLIAVGGQMRANNFDGMAMTLRSFGATLGPQYRDGIFFGGVDRAGEIDRNDIRERLDAKLWEWAKE